MTEVKQRAPGAGRKPINGEAMKTRSIRCTALQDQKLDALGGSEWIRTQVDAAPWPRGTKPKA